MNKLAHQYNKTCYYSIGKNLLDNYYSALTGKIESSHKVPKFSVVWRVRITKYRNIFSKRYTENWSREIFVYDSVVETNPWTYKNKD